MDVEIVHYDDFSGIRRTDLVHADSALPYSFWVSSFLSTSYNVENTSRSAAYQLRYVITYLESCGIDLVSRVEDGSLLTEDELNNIIFTFQYFADSKPLESKSQSLSFSSSKEISNLIFATRQSTSKVAVQTARARLRVLRKYFEFLFINIHKSGLRKPKQSLIQKFDYLIYQLKEEAKNLENDNTEVKDPHEQAIPSNIYFKLLDITRPENDENPWTKLNRFRNHIIFQIFNETGIRLGSLCKLKISDLRDDDNPRILITKIPNDSTDNRAKRPKTKTRPHASAISSSLMKNLLLYIETVRNNYSRSSLHDFIFVSQKGKSKGDPIASNTVNALIGNLSSVVNFDIHPHLLRHKWNEVFEEKGKAAGYTYEQINDLRKYACGWSETSSMARIYNEFRHATLVAEISQKEQEKTVPDLESTNEV